MIFNGTPITGTVHRHREPAGLVRRTDLNIGYFADVTSLVSAAGPATSPSPSTTGTRRATSGASTASACSSPTRTAADPTFLPRPRLGHLTSRTATIRRRARRGSPARDVFRPRATSFDRTAQLWLFAGDGEANRPDDTTVSNNPTLFNVLDSVPDGPQWTTDEYTINIPANVNTTVVQMHSRPPGQNPDSLLWEMAALRVALPSDISELPPTVPSCPTFVLSGPRPRP